MRVIEPRGDVHGHVHLRPRLMDRFMIRLIMKMTHGPTDTTAVIDYTNWDDVRAYGAHLLTLR